MDNVGMLKTSPFLAFTPTIAPQAGRSGCEWVVARHIPCTATSKENGDTHLTLKVIPTGTPSLTAVSTQVEIRLVVGVLYPGNI